MEYAKNGSLRAKLSEDVATPLGKEMALGLIADISYGMKYLYSKGMAIAAFSLTYTCYSASVSATSITQGPGAAE